MMTKEQEAAVYTKEQSFLLLASPGSGKTATVSKRADHLVESGCSPEDILVITFTRKAGEEIKNRCSYPIWGGTMHAICYEALRSPDVRVISQHESEALLMYCAVQTGVCQVTKGKNKWKINQSLCRENLWECNNPDLQRLSNLYQSTLKINGEVDYNGLIYHASRKTDTWKNLRHIIVDEAQDTDETQWNLVKHIISSADKDCTSMFVGDMKQSIYGWRNARPDIFASMSRVKMGLTTSFRCPSEILAPANRLIRNNPEGVVTESNFTGGDFSVKTYGVVDAVNEMLGNLIRLEKIAILCRSNSLVEKVCNELSEALIPCEAIMPSHSPDKLYWLLAYCASPYSPAVIEMFARSFELEASIVTGGPELVAAKLSGSGIKDLSKCVSGSLSQGATIDHILEHAPLAFRKSKEYWLGRYSGWKVRQALTDWSLPREEEPSSGVCHIMTIHQSKGLEFQGVVIPGVTEGKFPKSSSLKKISELEEERRVMYVALTRAQEKLTVLTDENPSSFVKEMLCPDYWNEFVRSSNREESSKTHQQTTSQNEGDPWSIF